MCPTPPVVLTSTRTAVLNSSSTYRRLPSELTLGGLLYHLSLEEDWMEARFAGLPDRELLHLIEETARHAGHADFLREAVDGTVGE